MFINGREVVYLDDKFNHVMKSEDKVDIFPPVGGG
jgi:molybdopterin converting factor small subunit